MTPQADILSAIQNVPLRHGRRIIAIVGPPASGKSTLAGALHEQIDGSCVLPMDGFHLSNAALDAAGMLDRKGAPNTFDVAGFEAVLRATRSQGSVRFPTFDRMQDRCIPDGGSIAVTDHTILVEGNYLLLGVAPWQQLSGLWDFSIMLDVSLAELERRLVQRWLTHGHDRASAVRRAQENDLINAQFMQAHSVPADKVITWG